MRERSGMRLRDESEKRAWFAGRARDIRRIFWCTAALTLLLCPACRAAGRKKIILDTDPGTDDAMALMLALNSPELDVQAITVVPGNVTAAPGLENALRTGSPAQR